MCQAYDQGIGFAAWMMNKEDHLKASAVGQMTKTIEVGKALAGSTADTVTAALEVLLTQWVQHSKWSFNRAPSLTSKSTLPAALILA